ncbi:unnamed protein product [Cyclocybe aegerita]|uniref:Uncharacterized protein n=1 Tax=Cyclocybe aegerita TaxID=1973307 RepID=A0A8S0XLN5_CYCAE|nr:unnamed protein product [Cyclocybe aegerita]
MSFFARPDSPPPRAPSPDVLPEPLPCHRHPRRVASQPKVRSPHHSPALPPGLHARTRTLQSARSADVLSIRSKSSDDSHSSVHSLTMRPVKTRTTLGVYDSPSPRSTPSTSPSPTPSPASSSRNSPDFTRRHRRTLSVVVPHPGSLSPNTTTDSLLPPVPSVPAAYTYTGPKHIICPKPMSFTPIYLPDIEELSHPPPVAPPRTTVRVNAVEQKSPTGTTASKTPSPPLPPLEKHRSMGIACLKFFGRGMRKQQQQPVSVPVV